MELDQSLEAILFHQGIPLTRKRLRDLLKCDADALDGAITKLEERLSHGGLRLLKKDDEIMLGTAPETSALIEAITKEEFSRDLSKAALETLSVVLYKGPITRGEIDHIRGVNSTFILRNLLVRGLVEKIENPKDQRSFLYRPSFALMQTLGITDIASMPRYEEVSVRLAAFEAEHEKEQEQAAENTSGSAGGDAREKPDLDPTDDATDIEIPNEDDQSELEADQTEEDEVGAGYLDPELRDALTDEMEPEAQDPASDQDKERPQNTP